jgi:phage gp36-like protein
MRFLQDSDYDVQIRAEIAKVIDPTTDKAKLLKAENMAIAQIRNHIAGRYDCTKIFTPITEGEDTRDQYIVMLVVDLALYHLWSKEGGNNIPKTRELRYNDALEWLKSIQKGESADLPTLTDSTGTEVSDVRIWSLRTKGDNQF